MEALISLNKKLIAIGQSDAHAWQKNLQRAPIFAGFAAELLALFNGKTVDCGSYDLQQEAALAV